MFIRRLTVQNFRLFSAGDVFVADDINIPDETGAGSGLTVYVGENGCGKSSLLEAMALPLLKYKAEAVTLQDLHDPLQKVQIELLSNASFKVPGVMPNNSFIAKGFSFDAGLRAKVSKSYLSSLIVSDQRFLKADGQEKPKDGSPDLRVNVNNPYSGNRFKDSDVLFLDKNRTFQTRSGTYNPTRFDRLMEDLSYQYLKGNEDHKDISGKLDEVLQGGENVLLETTIEKFKEISGSKVTLNFVENWQPFKRCFLAEKKDNNQQIPLDMMGSGYEMIFSLLYSFNLSQQSGKKLIVLIDEPELHLHPSLQERFVEVLLELSAVAQIIITTHSPLLVKQLSYNDNIKAEVLIRNSDSVEVAPVGERILPYVSANEVNYLAFGLATEEHHNELYEELKSLNGEEKGTKSFDIDYFQGEKDEPKSYPWMGHPKEVSIHTFVRNQIHHQKENGKADIDDLRTSIERMRQYIEELRTQ